MKRILRYIIGSFACLFMFLFIKAPNVHAESVLPAHVNIQYGGPYENAWTYVGDSLWVQACFTQAPGETGPSLHYI